MKMKWRISERLPVSFQAAALFLSLVILLSIITFQMLPETTWGEWGDHFSTLLMGVPTAVFTSPTASFPNQATGENFPQSPLEYNLSYQIRNERESDFDVSAAPLSNVVEISWPPSSSDPDNSSETSEVLITTSDINNVMATSPAPVPAGTTEKFLFPILSAQIGAGNQFMEYLSALVMARSLNRTLCLAPFFPGPLRHTGPVTSGLAWEDRYEVSLLSRFARVASLQQCLEQCNYTLDDKWILKFARELTLQNWKKYPFNNDSLHLNWDYSRWMAPKDIFETLGSRDARCVGVLGLFPGLRWRGAFLAATAFVRPAPWINKLAKRIQQYALGKDTQYLAVHWRFEESECNGHHVGLCFVRCDDGSVINSGLQPQAEEWKTACKYIDGHFPGVLLDKRDIVDTIRERALNQSVSKIYLATDGWMRGPESVALLNETVQSLRILGLTVVGLWKVQGLPNFADGKYFDPETTFGKDMNLNGAQIALVEQELCSRSVSFLGSGPSTLSLAVFRVRLARRLVKQIMEAAKLDGTANAKDPKAMDDLIAETLLNDRHPAGLHCRYVRRMKPPSVLETVETSDEEYPDGWLDLEACEGRMGRGGHCEVAKCF